MDKKEKSKMRQKENKKKVNPLIFFNYYFCLQYLFINLITYKEIEKILR